ncbi:MAG: hypothetical protein LBT97_11940 [Planctomycetota bacterium]|jgi:hypothetical protein|nr:hypothetical protein [Planctomycetota bacterium]
MEARMAQRTKHRLRFGWTFSGVLIRFGVLPGSLQSGDWRFNRHFAKLQPLILYRVAHWWTFGGNRANHRPIFFKGSTAFVSMDCFFVNSTQTRDLAKKA